MAVGVARAPRRPCCVLPAVCGRELCECVDTGHPIVCSSGNSSDTGKGALACAQWRGALVCTYTRKSFHRLHMLGRPPQSFPWGPGSPESRREGLNAAEMWIEE